MVGAGLAAASTVTSSVTFVEVSSVDNAQYQSELNHYPGCIIVFLYVVKISQHDSGISNWTHSHCKSSICEAVTGIT